MKKFILRLLFSFLFFLFLLEVALRVSGILNTYTESLGKGYTSYYNQKLNWYWLRDPNTAFTEKNVDFNYTFSTNAHGHREREIDSVFRDSSKIRVIVLGDSYTEGVGATGDSAYPRQMEHLLPQAAIYNACSAGSDPWFGYILLREKMAGYHPHIVIQAINPSDFTDYGFRGGFERFRADSSTVFKESPYCEPCYHYCFIYRLFIGVKYLMSNREEQLYYEAVNQLPAVADSFAVLASKHGFKILFLLHPAPCQNLSNEEDSKLEKTCISLLEREFIQRGHSVLNIYPEMDLVINADNVMSYGHDRDGHFKPAGYRLMAQIIQKKLKDTGHF